MDKVLDLLERQVQWLAIGLGAVILGAVAWTFVINSPVHTEIGGQKLGPGDVDRKAVEGPVNQLVGKMQVPTVPVIEDPHWQQGFVEAMEFKSLQPAQLAARDFPSWSLPTAVKAPTQDRSIGTGPGNTKIQPIAGLPVMQPPTMHAPFMGISSVVPPAAVAGAPADPGAAVAQPVSNVPPKDIAWVCQPFSISNKAIGDAFNSVKLDTKLARTAFVHIQLIRQEQGPDGSWGKETRIAALAIPGQQLMPMPAPDGATAMLRDYYVWAVAHQPDILQPHFWDIVKGDPWLPPTPSGPTTAPAAVAAAAGLPDFDPNRDYTIDEMKQMTPQQKQAYLQAKQKREAEERKRKADEARSRRPPPRGGSKGGSGGSGGSTGGGAGGGGGLGPNDGGRPPYPQPPPGYPRPPGYGRPPGYPPGYPPTGEEGMEPGMGGPGQAIAPNVPPPPGGEFVPSQPPPDWFGWAFDDSVQAGKTYRYKIVYSIKSPVWNYASLVTPPELAKIFALSSDAAKTDWGKEIKVPPRTSFYVATNSMQSSTAKIEVFAWQGGIKHSKQIDVGPGDMVGGVDNGVDYTTGWSVIEIKKDPVRTDVTSVLLSDPEGNLVKKDFTMDRSEYENEKKAAAASAAAAAAPSAAEPVAGTGR